MLRTLRNERATWLPGAERADRGFGPGGTACISERRSVGRSLTLARIARQMAGRRFAGRGTVSRCGDGGDHVTGRSLAGRRGGAWDGDVGIGRTGIAESLSCTRVPRLVFTPITNCRSAYGIALGDTTLRYLAWHRAMQATRHHQLGQFCCGHNLVVAKVAAHPFESSLGRGHSRPVLPPVAAHQGSWPEAYAHGF